MAPVPRFATVVRYALASRLLCVAWCVVADALLPDHDATGVRRWRRDAAPLLPLVEGSPAKRGRSLRKMSGGGPRLRSSSPDFSRTSGDLEGGVSG